jgi:formamidopyrimidine-DNA glycosylase
MHWRFAPNGADRHTQLCPRNFLAVHPRTGQPCPPCGAAIAYVGASRRITNCCRTCQPGGLIQGM